MNIFQLINEMTQYIEIHILDKITLNDLSKVTGLNASMIKNIFPLLSGCGVFEYIRNRRLSICVDDLRNDSKVIDVALKYGYHSANSFTRAFKKFHGITPNQIKKRTVDLKLYPKLILDESLVTDNSLQYKIYYHQNFILYGIRQKYKTEALSLYTETMWTQVKEDYPNFLTVDRRYGMTEHIDDIYSNYYCLLEKELPTFEKVEIPISNYLGIKITSFKANDISNEIRKSFRHYLKSLNFTAKKSPVIELYTKEYVELFIPIN